MTKIQQYIQINIFLQYFKLKFNFCALFLLVCTFVLDHKADPDSVQFNLVSFSCFCFLSLLLFFYFPGRVNQRPLTSPHVELLMKNLPMMSSQSARNCGISLLKRWRELQILTWRGVPKLDLMHCSYYYYFYYYYYYGSILVNIFCIAKNNLYSFTARARFVTFLKRQIWLVPLNIL